MGLGWARRRCAVAVAMSSGEGAFLLSKLLAQSGCNEMGAQRPLGDSCILSFQKDVYRIHTSTNQKVFLHVACAGLATCGHYIRFISVDEFDSLIQT